MSLANQWLVPLSALVALVLSSGCQGSEDPLMLAAREGNLDRIEAAVEGGTDVNTDFEPRRRSAEGGWWYRASTPVGTAACHGKDEATALLVSLGAKVDKKAGVKLNTPGEDGMHSEELTGWAPLSCAVWYGEFYGVEALLEAGAKVDIFDSKGQTPLILSMNKDPGIARALLAAGADPDLRDTQGRTALHWASVIDGVEATVELLLEAKANPNIEDGEGKTPMDLARNEETRNLLAAFGGKRAKEL